MEYVDSISIGGDAMHHLSLADHDKLHSVYQINDQAAKP
jgi:hypothetical protein